MKEDLKFHDDSGWAQAPNPQPEFNLEKVVARIKRRYLIRLIGRMAFRIALVVALGMAALAVFA